MLGCLDTCVVCGGEFFPKNEADIYCSDGCRKISEQRQAVREKLKKYSRECPVCGKPFKTDDIRMSYCSYECADYACHQLADDEERESTLKPNEVEVRLIIGNKYYDTRKNYKALSKRLREAVLQRDEFKCQICERDHGLHIHHIVPRAIGGRHVPENLITLCSGCHMSIENSANEDMAAMYCAHRAIREVEIRFAVVDK